MDKGIGSNTVVTIGIVVRDIEKTKQQYAEFFGVPVPETIVTGDLAESQQEYRGKPCPAKAKLAFFAAGGNLQIELIEPDEQPSFWRDTLDKKGEGVIEIGLSVKGLKEKAKILAEKGMSVIQKGEFTGGRYADIDTENALKVIFCLLEND